MLFGYVSGAYYDTTTTGQSATVERRHDDAARLEVAQRRLLREADRLRRPVPPPQRRLPGPARPSRPTSSTRSTTCRPPRYGRRHDELRRQRLGRLVPVEGHGPRGEVRLLRGERHVGGAERARAVPARGHQPQEPRRVRRLRRPDPQRRQHRRPRVRRDRRQVQAQRDQGHVQPVLRHRLDAAPVQDRRRVRGRRRTTPSARRTAGASGPPARRARPPSAAPRSPARSAPGTTRPSPPELPGANVLGVPPGHDHDEEPHGLPSASSPTRTTSPRSASPATSAARTPDPPLTSEHALQLHDVRLEPADPAAPRHHLEPEPA